MIRSRRHFQVIRRLFYRAMPAIALLLAIIAGSIEAADAQTFRGTILGTVSDSSGAIVPDATVTARNVATGLERSTRTDSSGNYSLPELPIGTYEVRVDMRGFQSTKVSDIAVAVASERRVDIAL